MAAPAGILNGTEIKIYAAGTLVAYATSGTINVNQSPRETTNKDSLGRKEVKEGLTDWTVDLEGMYAWVDDGGSAVSNADDLINSYILTRASMTITFGTTDTETGDTKYTGTVYMTSASLSAPTEESATFSSSFQGTGQLTQTIS
tara:strand:- start:970 stop:1404 length:435 start_codon:yes stop_codon:yes gene_type:complete